MQMQPSVWEIAADDVLSVVIASHECYDIARHEYGLTPMHLPEGAHREAFYAVCYLYDHGLPVVDTTILERCQHVTLTWVVQRIALYDTTRTGDVFRANVQLVKREGLAVGTRRLLQIAEQQISGGKDRELVVTQLMDALTNIGLDKTVKSVRASEHGPVNVQKRLSGTQPGISTGIGWLDEITNGFEPKHIWWLVGAYKSRKTTLALNMAASAALRNQSVAILSKEMPQKRVQDQITSMLAVSWLERQGQYDATVTTKQGKIVPLNWISPRWLNAIGAKYGELSPIKKTAIDYADSVYAKLPLRIYDAESEHGGLNDLASIERVISRDMNTDGGKLFFIDYLQLFDAPGGTIFDKISTLARTLQDIAKRKDITLCVLAQRNEENIKQAEESYSPGVKGGGDPAATADYLLTTRYNADGENSNPAKLTVQMKLSRHGPGGSGVKQVFDIHPDSGLILGQHWGRE